MGFGDFVRRAAQSIIHTPREVARATSATAKSRRHGSLKDQTKDPGTLFGGLGAGTIATIEQESEQRAEEKKNIEIAEQTAQQQAFEKEQTKKEKEAETKAAQERLARRRSSPGRPVFTTLQQRGSLL